MTGILIFIVICTILGAWSKGNAGRERALDRGFKLWNILQSLLFLPVCIVVGGLGFILIGSATGNTFLGVSAFSFLSLGTYRIWVSFWDIIWGYINRP